VFALTGILTLVTALAGFWVLGRDEGRPAASALALIPADAGPAAVPPTPSPLFADAGRARSTAALTPTIPVEPSPAVDAIRRPEPKARAGQGKLIVTAIPWAMVRVDGVEVGQTPVELEVAAGVHKVTLDNESLGIHKVERVRVKAGKTVRLSRNWEK
jgi:hypothetical protein